MGNGHTPGVGSAVAPSCAAPPPHHQWQASSSAWLAPPSSNPQGQLRGHIAIQPSPSPLQRPPKMWAPYAHAASPPHATPTAAHSPVAVRTWPFSNAPGCYSWSRWSKQAAGCCSCSFIPFPVLFLYYFFLTHSAFSLLTGLSSEEPDTVLPVKPSSQTAPVWDLTFSVVFYKSWQKEKQKEVFLS